MPLRILHVLSSTFYAGSVAYAVKIAGKQIEEGHQVILVSDKESLCDKLTCIALPVSDRSVIQRLKNIRFIKSIVKQYDINVVHAHSRAASWISFYALKGTKIPLVSTIHGRQVKKKSVKQMDVYGERVIAICPNLTNHLISEIQLDKKKVVCIPNGIDSEHLQGVARKRESETGNVISVIGRFNGPKGQLFAEIVANVFPTLLNDFPTLTIKLIGGEWDAFPEEGKQAFHSLNQKFKDRIQHLGFSRDIFQIIADSDLVVGAGRVALEGILMKIPVYAIGEACSHGILSSENIEEAIASNFGDILPYKSDIRVNTEKIKKEIKCFLNGQCSITDLTKWIESYQIESVLPGIMEVYRSAIMQKACPHPIPVLMYHKVPEYPINTKHRIFVTRKNFRKHLQFFKFRGLISITFDDYLAFSNGEIPIKEFPKKPFILTFDDGYKDNFENVLPLTQKYGFKGVMFLLGDFSVWANNWDEGEDLEAGRIMSQEEKKAFVDSGWEIGAHTLAHQDLTKLSFEKAQHEMFTSKSQLEEKLQTKVVSFAYPYGFYNDKIKELVKQSGFEFGISTDTGGMTIEEDRFAIFRVNMFPEDGWMQLYKKTSSWYRGYYKKKRGK